MDIDIERALPADAQALSDIATQTFRKSFGNLYNPADLKAHLAATCSVEFFANALAEEGDFIFIAYNGEQPVGYAKAGKITLPLTPVPPLSSEIHRLYVMPDFQKKGIGSKLMQFLLQSAAIRNSQNVYLGVWEHNHQAQKFYRRFGFAPAGEYLYFVGKQADREIIMSKKNF